jgi:hypothetical protein
MSASGRKRSPPDGCFAGIDGPTYCGAYCRFRVGLRGALRVGQIRGPEARSI